MVQQHPLQKLRSPSRTFSLLLHALGVASFSYNFHFLTVWETPFDLAYGWHFQFLTILGLSAALLSFSFGILADLTLAPVFFKAKNIISIVATPLEVVISILYWGLHLINPELLFVDNMRLPVLTDMGFHLAPSVFLTLDLVLLSPPWTIPAYGIMAMSTGLALSYWYWIELCFSHNGWYPYPIFGLLNTMQRALLFTFAAFLSTVSSMMLKWVYGKVNGYEGARVEAHKPLKKVQ
ncbi:FAR-17a/AIG1-like protein [Emericellopsis atlantica]|uniref:FAR-17a/AIG1-like protein n=1 Tax=Emericellopsis atlantica TaxID=2614577 RepID=A0A9P7ZJV1_9HYPO|nr:FAR-17a/AIG1-like protein [Emericellopsis atlantica]KAG9253271.1 FAR-17a/AIG1-like protein [Emericellopsis atlantica]